MVLLAIALGLFMASLDSTIVGACLRSIVQDLGHQDLVPGSVPHLFGRKWVFILALGLFEVGSLVCAVAPSMVILILGRAVAGLGGGGIFTMSYVIIADIVSARNRGKYQTLVSIVYGGASVVAPLLGGLFSDYTTWRWAFYVNLPLGFIAVTGAVLCMNFPSPSGSFMDKVKRIDVLDVFFLFTCVAMLIAALELGGSTYAWSSAPIIGLLFGFIVLFICFIYVELRIAAEPVIPASLFVNSSVPAILLSAFCLGAYFFAGLYYIALFYQVVNGDTATLAGVKAIPFVVGLVALSVTTGVLVSRTGRYKIFFYIGAGLSVIGIGLTASLNKDSLLVEKILYLFIFGLGAGVMTSVRMLAIQFSVPTEMIAIGSAVTQTMGTLGGSVGVAISGTIFNNIISTRASSLPVLAQSISELKEAGYGIDATQVLQLSKLLTTTPPFVSNGTIANAELIGIFGEAFKTAYFTLEVYPIVILVMTLFIVEFNYVKK
ncbi:MFS general substrate transporter [Rhizoclosmatium globosum]|uniref:MFS general substrate transporter n=1 Tax=Rhizoclosmatium globosum TaxID=329046 RepID=A0A1Y2C4P2_9FUNG|nr:MFS general substrate transporter [Rhizoclosmatium globosum]|eukprot:ORY41981.1 MFS general substrate transporter [Rhizoclosmatium globosum]